MKLYKKFAVIAMLAVLLSASAIAQNAYRISAPGLRKYSVAKFYKCG